MIDSLPSDIFQTGQLLNNTYEIQGLLGRGGTGEVYHAVNQVTGRIFAIKALNAQFSGNSDYIELMKREEEMRSIIHDAVVRYNECSRTDNGHVILVMDYIAGPSMADAMESRRFDAKELLIVAHRIAEGLVAAHSHGIVHRDISPDNIILRDGEPSAATLIDFGIAKDTAAGARTIVGNDFAGKYEYAAPEQLDGKADAQSDLYALGATLLAAFRGETPFLGTTPGEIVRRKQNPLDLEDVPEPLNQLLETLTAPVPNERPTDAQATVELVDDLIKPARKAKARGRRADQKPDRNKKGRSKLAILALGGTLALLFAGFFLRGVLFGPSLETVSPYTLSASKQSGTAAIDAYAPDQESVERLLATFASATGTTVDPESVRMALGMPGVNWLNETTALIQQLTALETWQLLVSDQQARLSGLATNSAEMQQIIQALDAWNAQTELSLTHNLQAGPEILSAEVVDSLLRDLSTCGRLQTKGQAFALGATVPVNGLAANASDTETIRQTLAPAIGSRTLDVDLTVLNDELCAIRAVLPGAPSTNISIWLGNGIDGSPNLTGVFTTQQNPLAEVLLPASLDDGYIWVMVVDITGKVFHIVPNINNTEQRISKLGTLEGGLRRIRVLHSVAEFEQDNAKIAVTVNEGDYGKSEIIAILSKRPLFNLRRPRDESVASVAKALSEAIRGREDDVLGLATRLVEARK